MRPRISIRGCVRPSVGPSVTRYFLMMRNWPKWCNTLGNVLVTLSNASLGNSRQLWTTLGQLWGNLLGNYWATPGRIYGPTLGLINLIFYPLLLKISERRCFWDKQTGYWIWPSPWWVWKGRGWISHKETRIQRCLFKVKQVHFWDWLNHRNYEGNLLFYFATFIDNCHIATSIGHLTFTGLLYLTNFKKWP